MGKNTIYHLSEFELKRMEKEWSNKCTNNALLLLTAVIMDEPEYKGNPEKVAEFFYRAQYYYEQMTSQEALIKLNDIKKIVEEYCDFKVILRTELEKEITK